MEIDGQAPGATITHDSHLHDRQPNMRTSTLPWHAEAAAPSELLRAAAPGDGGSPSAGLQCRAGAQPAARRASPAAAPLRRRGPCHRSRRVRSSCSSMGSTGFCTCTCAQHRRLSFMRCITAGRLHALTACTCRDSTARMPCARAGHYLQSQTCRSGRQRAQQEGSSSTPRSTCRCRRMCSPLRSGESRPARGWSQPGARIPTPGVPLALPPAAASSNAALFCAAKLCVHVKIEMNVDC